MKKQQLLFTLLMFIFIQKSTAQDSLFKKKLVIKFAPLSLFDIDNTFQFGIEHRINKNNRFSLSEEFGFGNPATNLTNIYYTNHPKRQHFKARVELKSYRKPKDFMSGNYVALDFFYKHVSDQITNNIGRECENFNCNYFEEVSYLVKKNVFAGNIKIGYQWLFKDRKEQKTRFLYDANIGIGIRKLISNHQEDFPVQNEGWFRNNNSILAKTGLGYKDYNVNILNLAFNFRVGYILF